MDKETQALITKALTKIQTVEEKFRKIQENSALHGSEYGLTTHELKLLEKVINFTGEINIAADAICRRALS